ncbi:MAG: lipoyl(octanoyl) transferase LipB [Burkholderiales bacterium]|nr:lipoyl(octanoyl) transferase LipB [Burkholderiales bacterium]
MIIRTLGRADYQATWDAMRAFTDARRADTPDELWVCEHAPVYTQGVAGRAEHLLGNPHGIAVVQTDRGGQITYHGPGQTMVYVLLDLRRAGYGVRALVERIERGVSALLAGYGIDAHGRRDAPGVYVRRAQAASSTADGGFAGEAKIASLGLKVRNGCTYHGVAFNVDMDLAPFASINPCGYAGLAVTDLATMTGGTPDFAAVSLALAQALQASLSENSFAPR